eukprot:CAMPEP_0168319868 /NCGR_PEP_ID=MMETSP0213-20121227/1310_1 /TAXON_ID=151035 /ORGANISM="Euplotes harpa, Strain FSP1.4" /LENGTH=266 /DNA_ID=CAMNT_0008321167 /DNA_START=906 /DNA_END=1706 /DNA_ORIENTATION=+
MAKVGGHFVAATSDPFVLDAGLLDSSGGGATVSVDVVTVVALVLTVVDAVPTEFSAVVRVPRTAVHSLPTPFDDAVPATVERKAIAVLAFVVSEVVAESCVIALTHADGWRRWSLLAARPAGLNLSIKGSSIPVQVVFVVAIFFDVGLDDPIATVSRTTLTAVGEVISRQAGVSGGVGVVIARVAVWSQALGACGPVLIDVACRDSLSCSLRSESARHSVVWSTSSCLNHAVELIVSFRPVEDGELLDHSFVVCSNFESVSTRSVV